MLSKSKKLCKIFVKRYGQIHISLSLYCAKVPAPARFAQKFPARFVQYYILLFLLVYDIIMLSVREEVPADRKELIEWNN